MGRKQAKLLALPGTPHDQAKEFRDFAAICEEGKIRCAIVMTIETDGTYGLLQTGQASLVEWLGMLALASDTVVRLAMKEGDDD